MSMTMGFAVRLEEDHPWETVRCDCEAPSDLARLVFCVPLRNNRSTGRVAAGVHRVALVKLACAKVSYR